MPTPTDDPFAGLTDDEIAELTAASAISPEDVADAARQWRTDAPSALRDLLDAPSADADDA